MAVRSCLRLLERGGFGRIGGGGGGSDGLLWHMELKPHASDDFSIAVPNSNWEDQSQVFTSPSATYVGVYDGHGVPEACRFLNCHVFPYPHKFALEQGGSSTDVIKKAFSATEEDFTHLVNRSLQEHGSVRFEESTSEYNLGNNLNAESPSSITNRTEATRSYRQHSRDSLHVHSQPLDWDSETLIGGLARGTPSTPSTPSTDSSPQIGSPILSHIPSKPPGLTQKALDCLHLEVFTSVGKYAEGETSRDCGICLESLENEDKLICLPCEHRFHSACLDPWVRACGDCPNCRRCIVVTSVEDA